MGKVELGKKTFEFDALETLYRNFIAPTFEIIIDGTNIVKQSIAVSTVSVNMRSEATADSFTFSVVNAYDVVKREFQWVNTYLAIGKNVEIKMGYTDKLQTLFYGLITEVSYDYPNTGVPTLTVTGMDISFLMMKGKIWHTYQKMSYSKIVGIIGKKYLPNVIADDTKKEHEKVSKKDMSDYHFIKWMAEEANRDFFVLGNTLYFREPLKEKVPVTTLSFGKNLKSYKTTMNLSEQVTEVIVRGYDADKREVVEAKSGSVDILGDNSKTGKDIMKTLPSGENMKEYIYTTLDNVADAKNKADAVMNQKSMQLVSGSGTSIGLPELQAGRYLELEGLGPKINQIMYIKSVSHTINGSGYVCNFTLGGNAI
jgi:phage protein D